MEFDFASVADYDAVVDVRSPAEYQDDHVPNACNLPALDDGQRHEVGKLYQRDRFASRRLGLACMAGNLEKMAAGYLADKGAEWRPLVYCWRGGMRSGTVVEAMRKVGWRAEALPGGYKTYRRHVIDSLGVLPARHEWVVLCGRTGSGKSLLLRELGRQGAQVLDLELLANHRGSLFGSMGPQPSQRSFESAVKAALDGFEQGRPVYVESESKMIGRLSVPACLLESMRAGRPVALEASAADRARLTMRDYAEFSRPDEFEPVVAKLSRYVGNDLVEQWRRLHAEGGHEQLALSLLENHYDRLYDKSLAKNFTDGDAPASVSLDPTDAHQIEAAAGKLLGQAPA